MGRDPNLSDVFGDEFSDALRPMRGIILAAVLGAIAWAGLWWWFA